MLDLPLGVLSRIEKIGAATSRGDVSFALVCKVFVPVHGYPTNALFPEYVINVFFSVCVEGYEEPTFCAQGARRLAQEVGV